jgi:hypothetical protein
METEKHPSSAVLGWYNEAHDKIAQQLQLDVNGPQTNQMQMPTNTDVKIILRILCTASPSLKVAQQYHEAISTCNQHYYF